MTATSLQTVKRYLPWLVATVLFMEQLDSTIVNTAVPSMANSLLVLLGLAQGFFNSLQFSSVNSMAYADIESRDSSMASTIASSMQQLSMSFGLACGSSIVAWYLGSLPQTDRVALTHALHGTFLTLAAVTMLSSVSFWRLRPNDGASVSGGPPPPVTTDLIREPAQ